MSAKKGLNLTLKIWRQKNNKSKGQFETYKISDVSTDSSFLEMLDMLNENLVNEGKEPVAFDHDCREGICGMCSLYINGRSHGPDTGITTCQLHMRMFKDGETIHIEPWRSAAFPVIKDLVVDRSAFDRVMAAGGFVSVNTSGNTLDANAIPVPKEDADKAMDAAACIGLSASSLGTGIAFASSVFPEVFTETKPPAAITLSKALLSTTKSLITGKAALLHGSMWMVSPSLNILMWSWQVVIPAPHENV